MGLLHVEMPGRAKRLKSETSAAHERLDKRIMVAKPFASRAGYGRFLKVQHAFHRDIDALYADARLDRLIPDLAGRRRFPAVGQDLVDLGVSVPEYGTAAAFTTQGTDVPTALGWLYVAEGSNLGAAFLLKEAEKLELSEAFGARHLAGAPEGRGLHWRTFTAALDAVDLSSDEEGRVIDGAIAAFARVASLVEDQMPLASEPTGI